MENFSFRARPVSGRLLPFDCTQQVKVVGAYSLGRFSDGKTVDEAGRGTHRATLKPVSLIEALCCRVVDPIELNIRCA
ncbi:sarcosine oxidase subunit beta [Anopheles sinensis]|uniref:Sarcosine oxidase subunit beta n=1 Tax=Anopheles sinensis TaxID=74873 RepID=A0A084VHG7_ANOSI|nr:sarcosine oxidase subunit beta [Anopheles sinensis]